MIKVGDKVRAVNADADYARSPDITLGKLYKVVEVWARAEDGNPAYGTGFKILDDVGYICDCLEFHCPFLGGGDWEVVNDSE